MKVTIAALLTFVGFPFATLADWQQFRGSQTDGIAESEASPGVAIGAQWEIPLPGRGLSSPVIVNNRLYLTASSGADQSTLHLLCFSTSDGTQLWERKLWATGRTMTHKKTCVAAPTPCSDGTRVFALYSSNDLACFDLDGNLLWLRSLMQDYPNASNSLGLASSPVIANGVLVVQIENDADSFAAGIDPKTGANIWRIKRTKKANWSSPIVLPDQTIVLQGSEGVSGVSATTGSVLWRYTDGASTVPSSVASRDGVLFAPSHGITALKPEQGKAEPTQLWRAPKASPGTPSPILHQNTILTINRTGILAAHSLEDGTKLWDLRLEGPFGGSPVTCGDLLYVFSERGQYQIVDLSGESGVVLETADLDDTIQCTPAIADNALFVRSDAKLTKFVETPAP